MKMGTDVAWTVGDGDRYCGDSWRYGQVIVLMQISDSKFKLQSAIVYAY